MRQEHTASLDQELHGSGIQSASTEGEEQLFIDIGRALWRNRFVVALVAFLGGVAGLGASYLFDVRYTAYAQVMIDLRVANDAALGLSSSGIPISLTALESELEVLRSIDLVENVVERFELTEDPEFVPADDEPPPLFSKSRVKQALLAALPLPGESPSGVGQEEADGPLNEELLANIEDPEKITAMRNFFDALSIEQVGDVSAVYSIAFTSEDPRKAALLANGLADEYIDRQIEDKLRSLERSQQWLTDRTSEVQQRLAELNVAVENHLLDSPYTTDDIQTMNARKATLQDELSELQAQSERSEIIIASVRDLRAEDPAAAAALFERPSPDLTRAMADGADAALRPVLDAELARLADEQERRDAQIEAVTAELETVTERLVEQASHDAQTRQFENEIRVHEAIYQDFVSQLSRRTQQDQFLDPDSRIISYARPPEYPSEPRRTEMAVIAAFLALTLASAIICIRELLQDKMRTVREFESATELPVVGIIPTIPKKNTPLEIFRTDRGALSPSTITFARKLYASVVAEQEHQPKGDSLRTRLGEQAKFVRTRHRGPEVPAISAERGQVIACAGSLPGEGTTTMNLLIAAACGYAGEKALLLDCDFWNSPYRGVGKADPGKYIEGIFSHERTPSIVARAEKIGIDIIPAPQGLKDPTALLTSAEYKRFVTHLAESYDRVIIDCAPLLTRIDTASIYRIADVVLLAARWNNTPRGAVSSALKVLADVGVTPNAVVATRVRLQIASSYGDEMFNYVRAVKA